MSSSNVIMLSKDITDCEHISIPDNHIFKQTNMTTPIVSVNIMGGLGNQMFQLATAYAYAKKYNGNLKILRNKQFNDYRPTYWDTILSNFKEYLVDSVPSNLISWNELGATEYSIIPSLTNNGIFLKGYFQSSLYFGDDETKKEIKALFSPSKELLNNIYKKYKHLIDIKERIIVVHARRTDYLRNQDIIDFHGPLTVEYYKQAIKNISEKINDPIFLLVSDDSSFWISIINEIPKLIQNNIYILDEETDIHTFILLQQFNNFIISNSTFIWWACWLTDSKNVIAPLKWFGPKGPQRYEDIYEPHWIRI